MRFFSFKFLFIFLLFLVLAGCAETGTTTVSSNTSTEQGSGSGSNDGNNDSNDGSSGNNDNTPPEISVSISYSVNSNSSYTFSADIKNNTSSGAVSYLWDFGDNITSSGIISEEKPTVTFKSNGSFMVSLEVDIDGKKYSASKQVDVTNILEIEAVINYAVNNDGSYSFYADIKNYTSSSGKISFLWDFGDNITGLGVISEEKPTVTFKSNGSFMVSLDVDIDGKKYFATKLVEVSNIIVNEGSVIVSSEKISENSFKFSAEIKNISGSNIQYSWNFGDEINETGQNSVSNPNISYKYQGKKNVVLNITVDSKKYQSNTVTVEYYKPVIMGGEYGRWFGKPYFFAVNKGQLYNWGTLVGSDSSAVTSTPKVISGLPEGEVIKEIAFGERHTLFLSEKGKVYSMGENLKGQLGSEDTSVSYSYPVEVTGLTGKNIVKITAGTNVSYAIDDKGVLYSWGSNDGGILGLGIAESYKGMPSEVTFFTKNNIQVKELSYSNNVVLVLGSDKKVYSWGKNNGDGTDGHGENKDHNEPKMINALKDINVIQVLTKNFSSYCVTETGDVYGWGWNYYGELGNGGSESIPTPAKISGLSNIRKVAKGTSTAYAIDNNNDVYSWGYNDYGQLGRSDGSLIGKISSIANVSDIIPISSTVFAIDNKGSIYGWGDDFYSQIGDNNPFGSVTSPKAVNIFKDSNGAEVKDVVVKSIMGIEGYSYFITDDGRLFGAGDNGYNSVGTGSNESNIFYFTEITFQ